MPTFVIFKQGKEVERLIGANPTNLQSTIKKLAAEIEGNSSDGFSNAGASSSQGGSTWRTEELPKGYNDVTDQIDTKGLEVLNAGSTQGNIRALFDGTKPSATTPHVVSDSDEQLLIFVPFSSTLKVHTLRVC